MLKKIATTKMLLIAFTVIVLLIAFICYGLITRCDNVAIYKYCPTAEPQSGR